jgi:hypothetical protein
MRNEQGGKRGPVIKDTDYFILIDLHDVTIHYSCGSSYSIELTGKAHKIPLYREQQQLLLYLVQKQQLFNLPCEKITSLTRYLAMDRPLPIFDRKALGSNVALGFLRLAIKSTSRSDEGLAPYR